MVRSNMPSCAFTLLSSLFYPTRTIIIVNLLSEYLAQIQGVIEYFTKEGSGWIVNRVVSLHITISKYQPLRGGSYIKLPKYIRDKKACINVKKRE